MEGLLIAIPSHQRWKMFEKGTISYIPKNLYGQTCIVVGEDEADEYHEVVPEGVTVFCPNTKGIAQTRQWIMEKTIELGYKYVLYLSDDLSFSYRNEEEKLKPAKKSHFVKMIDQLYDWLKQGYVHVGVSQRAFNHTTTGPYTEITRMNDVYAYEAAKVLEHGACFDNLPVMEDFDVTLTLLKKGEPNIVTHEYAWSQRKSGEEGGCSEYRTWKMQRDAAFALSNRHPGLVKVLTKKSKSQWEGVGSTRVDVNIYWKKAYKPKRTKNVDFFGGLK